MLTLVSLKILPKIQKLSLKIFISKILGSLSALEKSADFLLMNAYLVPKNAWN